MLDDVRITDAMVASVPRLIAVYRFGSSASGDARPDSDVDIAFLAISRLDPVVRFNLQEELAVQLHRSVDLVDLRAASTVMRMQVISTGIPILTVDDGERERFETYTYSAYARLNEERREILNQVRREGRVYDG